MREGRFSQISTTKTLLCESPTPSHANTPSKFSTLKPFLPLARDHFLSSSSPTQPSQSTLRLPFLLISTQHNLPPLSTTSPASHNPPLTPHHIPIIAINQCWDRTLLYFLSQNANPCVGFPYVLQRKLENGNGQWGKGNGWKRKISQISNLLFSFVRVHNYISPVSARID